MIDNLTIGQAKELAGMFGGGKAATVQGGGRAVIVRSKDAGVQFGFLESYAADGSTVTLTKARQMWSWTAKEGGTLLDCAMHGVKAGKFSGPADRVVVIGACAIIDCSKAAAESLASHGSDKWA